MSRNEVTISELWGKPACGYNVKLRLSETVAASLSEVQDEIARIEPTLLPVPPRAMHISVAWLLAVHIDDPRMKQQLWARHGSTWLRELQAIAAATPQFELQYDSVVVTDSAIIALAFPTEPVNRIRRSINQTVELPAEAQNATIVHTSLFRYGARLSDPAPLLELTTGIQLTVPASIDHLVVYRENVYPSLAIDVLATLPLANRRS